MFSIPVKVKTLKYPLAILLGIFYLLVQLHFMQQYLDWDQIAYYWNVQRTLKPGELPVYNPHHLHLETGSKYFHQAMLKYAGEAGFTDLLFNNRLKSVIAASLGLVFACLYLTNVTGKLSWGVLGSLLIGVSHGYLVYAAKFDTGIFPAFGIILYLWIMEKMNRTRKRIYLMAIVAGIVLFCGLMFHQYLGIACVTFFFSIILPSFLFEEHRFFRSFVHFGKKTGGCLEHSALSRYLAAFLMTIVCILLTVSAYFWAGKSQYNLPFSPDDHRPTRGIFGRVLFQKWLFIYETAGAWGKGYEEFDPRSPFRGYTDAFLSRGAGRYKYNQNYHFAYNLQEPLKLSARPANALALFTLLTLAGSLLFLPALFRRYKRCFVFLFSTTVLHILFATYWESFYFEFWIVPAVLVTLLGVLLFNLWVEKCKSMRIPVLALAFYLSFTVFIGLTAGHNLHEHLIPYSRNRVLEAGGSETRKANFRKIFSRSIYMHPDDPYQTIKKRSPETGL